MTESPPRPVLYAGVAVGLALLATALWAWSRWGGGVFFDTIVGGMTTCL